MNEHPWYGDCVKEIDRALARGRKLRIWEVGFLSNVKHRIRLGWGLTTKQEKNLWELYERMTDIQRIYR